MMMVMFTTVIVMTMVMMMIMMMKVLLVKILFLGVCLCEQQAGCQGLKPKYNYLVSPNQTRPNQTRPNKTKTTKKRILWEACLVLKFLLDLSPSRTLFESVLYQEWWVWSIFCDGPGGDTRLLLRPTQLPLWKRSHRKIGSVSFPFILLHPSPQFLSGLIPCYSFC